MDRRLLAWGQGGRVLSRRSVLPRLWLFTDARRLPDPLPAIARLPVGRAGVVFRHDGARDRANLGRAVAQLCRARRLILVVAGDSRLAAALGAGMHLRGGRFPDSRRPPGILTSSAHDVRQVRLAAQVGAKVIFLSPAFPTASHPGSAALGPLRWSAIARHAPRRAVVAALGGVDGGSVRRLPPRWCGAAGAIGALA